MNKVEITVERPNGQTEVVDMTGKVDAMNKAILAQMRKATKDAGRGYILKSVVTRPASNLMDLEQAWINVHNEGGFGFVPDGDYFRAQPDYREWVETETYL